MKTKKVPISQVQIDPHNPRTITNEKFEELKQSIIDFPEMQLVKPLVIADGLVIGGNMRLLAYKDLGYREVDVIDVTTWTQAKRDEFMIRDNTHYGVWDYDALANEWDNLPLNDWGLEVWQPEEDVDYSILESLDLGEVLSDKEAGVKRAIQIEFDPEHYDQALLLINQARKDLKNVGMIVLEAFRNER